MSSEYGNLTAHIQVSHSQTPTLTSSSFSSGQHQRSDLAILSPDHTAHPHPGDSSGAASLNLTLNQFTLGQDQAQQAMIDLYYKTLTSPTVPSYARLDHSHLMPDPISLFNSKIEDGRIVNNKSDVKIKEEPLVCAATSLHRSRTLSRKQSHPRRTLNALSIDTSDESTEDDTKVCICMNDI